MKAVLIALVVVAAAAAVVSAAPARPDVPHLAQYAGEQVLRCTLATAEDVAAFERIKEEQHLDVWTHHYGAGAVVDVRGSPAALRPLRARLACEVYADDVAELLAAEARQTAEHLRKRGAAADFFDDYHTFEELIAYYAELATRFPTLTTWVPSIGKTVQGRDLAVLRIKSPRNLTPAKTIWYDGCIHAREWISPATVAYITTKLLEGYGVDNTTTTMVDRFEFVVAPCINPDGYAFSWSTDRLWRKNRATNAGSTCIGVDLNRNFNNHWGGVGASAQPCAQDFRGPSVASEPETKAVQNYILTLRNRASAIDFHSYGQLILRSFGYTVQPSSDEAVLKQVGDGMRDAILAQSGKRYTSQRAAELYPTTGSTDDWFTEQAGMWGWTLELRDEGRYGFRLPADQIKPTGEEIWAAFVYFSDAVWRLGPASN